MLFSVIYSFEVPGNESVNDYYPSNWRKLWDLTEVEFDSYGLDDAGTPIYERWKHRKITALLTKEQFLDFIVECSLAPEDVETLGSLGSPGFGFGWSPAISFNMLQDGYLHGFGDAYVTPMPLAKLTADNEIECVVEKALPLGERHWEKLRRFIIDNIVEIAQSRDME